MIELKEISQLPQIKKPASKRENGGITAGFTQREIGRRFL
jgi:hypothetical protein